MRVKTPSKPTVKGLTEILLHSLGDPRALSGTENGKTIRILKLMHGASTKMLMIDEFQHFYDKGSNKVMHHVADWLKILVDEANIALVVSGIPSCRAVIEQNEQLSGRFMAPIVMPRFDWSKDEERDEFTAILGAFHESLSSCFDLPALDSNDMAFRCYCATGGLIGYLTKFLRQVVWNALDNASRVISIDDLAKAHEQAICKDRGNYNFGPFDSHSQLAANAELMASVMALGRGTTTSTKTRRGRNPSSSGLTPRDVLTAS
jgi:Bacterial TniB protein.